MVPAGAHVGVAVSGGADSVVLLHVLYALLSSAGHRLTVLHVNHQLRGAESDGDEEFVSHLAQSLGLALLRTAGPLTKGNLEQEARRIRQEFFRDCREQHGIHRIALGHNRSDQAETVLFRLLRGSGTAGLAGMTPVTRLGLIRPLFFVSRSEIRDFARANQIIWREDSSNSDQKFRRNRLRLTALPGLAADFNPSLEQVLARTASLAATEEEFWRKRTAKLHRLVVRQTSAGLTLAVPALHQLHLAEQRRLVRRMLLSVKTNLRSINLSHVDGVLEICRSGHGHDRVMLPGVDAIRSFDTLLLTSPETMRQMRGFEYSLSHSVSLDLPFGGGRLIVNPVNSKPENCVNVKDTVDGVSEAACLDRDAVSRLSVDQTLRIRNWEPGDTFQRKGQSRPEKIKVLFQENRVVLWKRRHWPVLLAGNQIVWVRGFGSDPRFSPTENTKNLLLIRYLSPD